MKERRTNKHGLGLAPSARKEVLALFCGFLCICGYREHVSEWNSHTATRNTDLSSHIGWPGFCIHWSQLLLQQPPLSLSLWRLPFANSSLLLTVLGPCLSLSSSCLIGNFVHKCFVWFSCQSRQRNPLTGAHPQKQMPPSPCHKTCILCCIKMWHSSIYTYN